MCLLEPVTTNRKEFEFIKYPFNKEDNRPFYNLPKLYEWEKPNYGIGLKSFGRDVKGVLRSQFFSDVRVPEGHWIDAQECNPRGNVIPFTACTRQDPVVKAYRAGWHLYTDIFSLSAKHQLKELNLTPVVFCEPYLQEQKTKLNFRQQLVAVYLFVPEQGGTQDDQIRAFLNRKILKYEEKNPEEALDNGLQYELFELSNWFQEESPI